MNTLVSLRNAPDRMISIVIPTLNEERQLGRVLASICTQDFKENYEVIIADAHSTDRTREIALSFRGRIKRLTIVDGGPPAVARNNAARKAAGDIIFFLDADTSPSTPSFLRENVAFFRNRNLAAAVTPLLPRSTNLFDHLSASVANAVMRLAQYWRPQGAMCLAARRDVWEKTGGYPEDVVLAEDHDFLEACMKFGPVRMLPIAATYSVRRYEKEGRLVLHFKYIYATLYRMFVGPIRKPLFAYEFTYEKKVDV